MSLGAEVRRSTKKAEDVEEYLTRARTRSREIGDQIQTFTARVAALRDLSAQVEAFTSKITSLRGEPPRGAPESHAHGDWLRAHVVRQGEELTLAREELLAQHEALKEAHAQLQLERERYLDLFEHAPDAYVTTDGRGAIREANLAAAALLGVGREVLLGKLLIAFVARRDTRAFRDRLNELRQSTGQHVLSVKLRARGGIPFPATVSVRSVRDGDEGVDMRFTIRPVRHVASESEVDLLRATAEDLRASFEGHGGPFLRVVEDVEQLALAGRELPQEAVAPADIVWRALGRARAHAGAANVRLHVGSIEDGASLCLTPDRAVWALARLVLLVQDAKLRGWRDGSRYVLELRVEEGDSRIEGKGLGRAAVRAALAAEGATLRISSPGDDGDPALVCEIAFPLASPSDPPESSGDLDGDPPSSALRSPARS
ncbi:MAG TPA: PAS domain S-box protein [Polyangiaceae bacterium]|jgi:PAS domain S-box-containing protein